MALDPQKKKLLLIGIPVVIGLAIFFLVKSKSSGAPAATTGVASTGTSGANPAIDVGQLSAFESNVSQQQAQILAALGKLNGSEPGVTPPPATNPGGPMRGVSGIHPIGPAWAPGAPGSAPDAVNQVSPQNLPGYGAGVAQLDALNGGAANVAAASGIAGYHATYNGVPIS